WRCHSPVISVIGAGQRGCWATTTVQPPPCALCGGTARWDHEGVLEGVWEFLLQARDSTMHPRPPLATVPRSPYYVTAGCPYTPVCARDHQPASPREDNAYAVLARVCWLPLSL